MASLNADSGYGGSIASGSVMDGDEGAGWRADMMVDKPTPVPTPPGMGNWNPAAEHEKQVIASHVHQLL
jgi:mitofusin